MFENSLLESTNIARKNKDKRWPMTFAFVLETITVCFLLIVPLMSTGVIPVAHVLACPYIAPFHPVEVVDHTTTETPGSTGTIAGPSRVVTITSNRNALRFGDSPRNADPNVEVTGEISGIEGPQIGNLIVCESNCTAIARPAPPVTRLRLSHLEEALLVHKVDPVYPHTAVITHTSGEVQLHAIIGKDGSIQSLSVTKGNPILAQAALEAVRQWRYKPYILNDAAVEVETFITVNFRAATN